MKNKINATTVIKIVGWVATAVGGILVIDYDGYSW